METFTWKLELELGAVGAGWTDVTNDVGPIVLTDGMQSTSMIDLIALEGQAEVLAAEIQKRGG